MSSEFSRSYLALLKQSISDEINFLISNGHVLKEPHRNEPCLFCVKDEFSREFVCHRARRLNDLLSEVKRKQKEINPNRPKIGYLVSSPEEFLSENEIKSSSKLPLLLKPL